MTETPERIWATEDADNFGEDRFHTTRPMAGLTEYIRADIHDAAVSAARKEGMLAARDIALADEANDWTDGVPRGGIIAEAIDDAIAAETTP